MRTSLPAPLLLAALLFLLAACVPAVVTAPTPQPSLPAALPSPTDTDTPAPTLTLTATSTPEPLTVRFAVIGDFGLSGPVEADVAALVHQWEPDIIITVGDNNYPSGGADTIDENIGQYYHDYIHPYSGVYGDGAAQNRFFPTLGNHDWYTEGAQPYFDFFTLPGNERYYDLTWGPVHFFALNSGDVEPDGVGSRSIQAEWLKARLTASTSAWQVVYFHYAPYSSGEDGPIDWMRWPYAEWGADAVFSGHYHAYERLLVGGIPYFVLAPGGGPLYRFLDPLPETQYRYNADQGAMLVTASETEMLCEFYNRAGELIDSYLVSKP